MSTPARSKITLLNKRQTKMSKALTKVITHNVHPDTKSFAKKQAIQKIANATANFKTMIHSEKWSARYESKPPTGNRTTKNAATILYPQKHLQQYLSHEPTSKAN